MKVEVRPVASRRDLTRFIKLPWRLYRNEPHWIPPLVSERRRFLDRDKNPFFEHAEAEYFLAWRDGEPVGRISAHIDRRLNEFQGNDWGLFGFFESEDDPEVARALLDAAAGWLARARAGSEMLGPMDFTTNDECGLLVEGYDREPIDPPAAGTTPTTRSCSREPGSTKAMDLYMWELRLDKVEDKGGFHPMIHADGREGRRGARRHGPQHAKAGLRGRAGALHGGLQRRLGAQLGLRAADRRRRSATTPRT